MPTQKLTQNSFTSGQYDRAVQGKEQSELVASGLAKAMNVVSSESGELRKRLGTKFLMDLNEEAVVVPFRSPDGDDVMLLCTDKKIKAYEFIDGKLQPYIVLSGEAPVFPSSGWSGNTNGDYTINLSSETSPSSWGVGFNYNQYFRDGSVFVADDKTQTAFIEISSKNPQVINTLSVRWENSYDGAYDGYYKGWIAPVLQYSDDGVSWVAVNTDCRNPKNGDSGIRQVSGVRPGVFDHNVYNITEMKIININHTTPHRYWRVWFIKRLVSTKFSGETLELFVYDVSYSPSDKKEFEEETPFTTKTLREIKYAQDYSTLILAAEGVSPYQIKFSSSGLEGGEFKSLSGEGTEEFSNPTSVAFFQNRLWFSGVIGFPTTILGSKFGNYDEFGYTLTKSGSAQHDDALNLKSNQLRSKIKNIVGGQKVLYCFSEDGISFVDGGSGGLIATNDSISFLLRNRMPASDATPTFKDDVLLYGSYDGKKIYTVDYDLLVERFQVDDIAKYAKDVMSSQLKELHYVGNQAKLIYGLMENNNMFALLYNKGKHNGFYPLSIQNGFVYDMCSIKYNGVNRLVMVVNRSGKRSLEELLDVGNYISTDSPLMSNEDKKWATYDNLENNIALDCYKTYENAVYDNIKVDGDVVETTVDLEKYVGQTVMFAQENSKDFLQAEIKSVSKSNFYCWTGDRDTPEKGTYWFTNSSKPNENDILFSGSGEQAFVVLDYVEDDGYGHEYITCRNINSSSTTFPVYTFYRYETKDYVKTNATIQKLAQRGDSSSYTKVLLPFDTFRTNFTAGIEVGVVSQGRYMGEFVVDNNGYVVLPFAVNKIIYGATYESYGIIKVQKPYESMKSVQQINISVIDTAHLQVGTGFNDLQELEKIKDDSHYDLTNITMNGSYRIVPSDTPEWDKYIILRSVKGLPFTVVGVEAFMNYSNTGGN